MNASRVLFEADALADPGGLRSSPGALLVQPGGAPGAPARVLAAGSTSDVATHPGAHAARRVALPGRVLIPGLVNAHTHLDLTHIGPRPFDPERGFSGFAEGVISGRHTDPDALARSVRRGVEMSLAGGVVAVGDIAGVMRLEPLHELRESGLLGVSFIEFFGVGEGQEAAAARVAAMLDSLSAAEPHPRVRLGLQPHAPYSVGSRLYRWAARTAAARGLPISTHLAETLDERRFVADGDGPFRALVQRLGQWDASILKDVGRGLHPVAHVEAALATATFLLAHVNDCDDAAIEVLARSGASVAYCPRSSAYFRNHEACGPHRYRDMLRAGINVALATDSVINLPPASPGEPDRLSTLDEMRFLFRRDSTDPALLLRMATVNGAAALGLDPALFRFTPACPGDGVPALPPRGGGESAGPIAGVVAVGVHGTDPREEPMRRVLLALGRPLLLVTASGDVRA